MRFLHPMIRVLDLNRSLDFFINKLGLTETRRYEVPEGKFTLIFLVATSGEPEIELTYNWDQKEAYSEGRNFGHLAFSVKNIHEYCEKLQSQGIVIIDLPGMAEWLLSALLTTYP